MPAYSNSPKGNGKQLELAGVEIAVLVVYFKYAVNNYTKRGFTVCLQSRVIFVHFEEVTRLCTDWNFG